MSFGITLRIMSYNRPDYLKEALDSAFDQTVPFDSIEVYDNGSRPEVLRFLDEYGRGIKIRKFSPNSKTTWECAFGELCESNFLCVFHDDDVVGQDFVKITLENFKRIPHLVAHSSNGRRIGADGRIERGLLLNVGRSLIFSDPAKLAEHCLDSCIPWAPTTYLWNNRLGENYRKARMYGRLEDVGMFFFILQGGAIYLEKNPLYDCRTHPDSGSQRLGWHEEEQLWNICHKNYPPNPAGWRKIKLKLQKRYTDRWFHDWLKSSPGLPHLVWRKLSLSALHRCCRNNKLKILRRVVAGKL